MIGQVKLQGVIFEEIEFWTSYLKYYYIEQIWKFKTVKHINFIL